MLQGEVLAVSPYESHLDERLFGPHAAAYDLDRPALRLGDGAVPGVGGLSGLVFGGGKYRRVRSIILCNLGQCLVCFLLVDSVLSGKELGGFRAWECRENAKGKRRLLGKVGALITCLS